MNGVGKQTNSSLDSIKCSVITIMDDVKGIGRRVNQNPHHPKELRQMRQGKGSRYQPLPSCANSRPGELIKKNLQSLGGRHRVFDQENREFPSRLDTVLIVIFAFVFFFYR